MTEWPIVLGTPDGVTVQPPQRGAMAAALPVDLPEKDPADTRLYPIDLSLFAGPTGDDTIQTASVSTVPGLTVTVQSAATVPVLTVSGGTGGIDYVPVLTTTWFSGQVLNTTFRVPVRAAAEN